MDILNNRFPVPMLPSPFESSVHEPTMTRRTFKQLLVKYFLAGLLVPMLFVQTLYWLLAFRNGFWRFFATRYEMSLVMMFGSAVGGATAEGSGAIAFPVLTLAFKVPATTARDFAFMIQTIGMNSAAITVLFMGILVEKHTLILASIGGSVGTIICLEFLDRLLAPDLKKMVFVSVFFSFAIALFLLNLDKKRKTFDKIQNFDLKKSILLVVVGFFGGLLSGISGSGLDVFAFSVITLLFRVNEKVATPTTVSLAGINSAVGFFWRHQMHNAIQPLAWEYFAVCIPIVSIFAPLGSLVSSHFHRQTLAIFIYILETVAIVSAFAIIQPATLAPTPKTIQFDILFIVDETEDEKFIPDVAEKFIENIMEIFSPSQRRARVGLITMPQKEKKSMPVAFLSSIDSFEALDRNLVSLEDFNIEGDKECIVQALHFANDPNKIKNKENGYRDQIDNHLIVILTAKSKITDIDGAMTEIDNISKDASYGIIAVGYNYGQTASDWTDVKKLASGDSRRSSPIRMNLWAALWTSSKVPSGMRRSTEAFIVPPAN
ncbi:hypothetical protein PRIPAC_81783 [Pristionchus pacificus]|uniref:VWA domain-containing protein n=1 Tax=Pristionchus pacificus TaxID=54126 RepID=A0A2A6CKM5_PRIPA|nr:hypothetical protein PRIPAC_81783 [Pristionchus pacificus]|eukprot:PDM78581.1 VWA domain-containing protein [Pristionchus pacificus]